MAIYIYDMNRLYILNQLLTCNNIHIIDSFVYIRQYKFYLSEMVDDFLLANSNIGLEKCERNIC